MVIYATGAGTVSRVPARYHARRHDLTGRRHNIIRASTLLPLFDLRRPWLSSASGVCSLTRIDASTVKELLSQHPLCGGPPHLREHRNSANLLRPHRPTRPTALRNRLPSGHYDDGCPEHSESPQLGLPAPHAASMSPTHNCNVSDLIPARKSSNRVLSPRLFFSHRCFVALFGVLPGSIAKLSFRYL
jgi:hypothetical protein